MDLTQLNPAVLESLLKLSQEKATLLKRIEAIDKEINSVAAGRAPAKKAAPAPARAVRGKKATPKAPAARRARRGTLKDKILSLLAAAGPGGTTVQEIAQKLGTKTQNIHVWFSSTGKKLAEVAKIGESRYAIAGAAPAQQLQQPEA